MRSVTALSALILLAAPALQAAPVVERMPEGSVDWANKVLRVTGAADANMDLKNLAAIRQDAAVRARSAARRAATKLVGRLRVAAGVDAAAILKGPSALQQVKILLQACESVATEFFVDKGVSVTVECPLDGTIAAVLTPDAEHRPAEFAAEALHTGLIIDARHLGILPALSPVIRDATQKVVYDKAQVTPTVTRDRGTVAYFDTVESATLSGRVGEKPLIIKAESLGPESIDIVVGAGAMKAEPNPSFLSSGHVAIVCSAPKPGQESADKAQ